MVQVNASVRVVGETDLSYSTVLIGTPDTAHKVSNITLIQNVVESTIVENVGYDCALGDMYKGFIAEDTNQETNLSIILLPVASDATPTKLTYAFSGTASAAGTISFKIFSETGIYDFAMGATAGEIATGLVGKINAIENCPFTASASSDSLVLTAKSVNSYYDTSKAVFVSSDTGITIADVTVENATGTASLDDIKDFLDSNNVKFFTYLVQKGLDLEPLIEALKEYQTINDQDMIGRLMTFEYNTYANLIANSQRYNRKFITLAGLKAGALDITEDEVLGHLGGFLAMVLTDGIDITKYGLVRGSLSNASLPYEECVFDGLTLNDGAKFSKAELNNLTKNGVWTFYNNAAGNMAMKEFTTTMYMTTDGKPSNIYKKGQVDLCSNIALSYNFQTLKNQFPHSRLDALTKSAVKTRLSANYDVLSNQAKDNDTGKSYYVLDPEGKKDFQASVEKNLKVNYVDGTITIDNIINTVVAQLAIINLSFINKKYIGD